MELAKKFGRTGTNKLSKSGIRNTTDFREWFRESSRREREAIKENCNCLNRDPYQPFDDRKQQTDLTLYRPPFVFKYLDQFGTWVEEGEDEVQTPPAPDELPKSLAGVILTFFSYSIILALVINAASKIFSGQSTLVSWEPIHINVDYVCPQLQDFDATSSSIKINERPIKSGNHIYKKIDGCDWNDKYFGEFEPIDSGEKPYMDLPALTWKWKQEIQFYEEDGKSALSKIEWRDKNGMHFGSTSRQTGVPVAMGAHEKMPVQYDSYPEGGSDVRVLV